MWTLIVPSLIISDSCYKAIPAFAQREEGYNPCAFFLHRRNRLSSALKSLYEPIRDVGHADLVAGFKQLHLMLHSASPAFWMKSKRNPGIHRPKNEKQG